MVIPRSRQRSAALGGFVTLVVDLLPDRVAVASQAARGGRYRLPPRSEDIAAIAGASRW